MDSKRRILTKRKHNRNYCFFFDCFFFLEVNISFGFYLVSVCGSKFAEFCCCVHLGCFDFVVVIWRLLLLFFVWGLFVSVLSSMIHIWMQKILFYPLFVKSQFIQVFAFTDVRHFETNISMSTIDMPVNKSFH